jgi:multiple sugar transport system substrate-binding protein
MGPDTMRDLARAYAAGRISRRSFIMRLGALGMSGLGISAALAAVEAGAASASSRPARPPVSRVLNQTAPTGAGDEIAVEAAKAFAGSTITVTWESGPQSLGTKTYGPIWEDLTGIHVETVELDHPDLFSKAIAEHIAGSGAYDMLELSTAWVPDLVAGGVILPVADWVARYQPAEDIADYHPLFEGLQHYQGQQWGLFDDGDTLIFYYRKDIFEELGLTPPTTWEEFITTAQTITDAKSAEGIYGAGFWRKDFNGFDFYQQYRSRGGTFFDTANNMRTLINGDIGVQTLTSMVAQLVPAHPDSVTWQPIPVLNAWMEGKLAQVMWWPPFGRWSEGLAEGIEEVSFVPKSTVVGKAGYAVMPNGHGQMTGGFLLCVSPESANQEAAYLFAQWLTSPRISLERVMSPVYLVDPYRLSHYSAPEYAALWPNASEYLDALRNAASVAVIEPVYPGAQDYSLSIDRACTSAYAGTDPKSALDTAAQEWNDITDRLGVDSQRAAYEEWLKYKGATKDNVVGDV